MEVNMNIMANQEMAQNNIRTGQDILQKPLEKSEESRQNGQSVERPETGTVKSPNSRLIDTYA